MQLTHKAVTRGVASVLQLTQSHVNGEGRQGSPPHCLSIGYRTCSEANCSTEFAETQPKEEKNNQTTDGYDDMHTIQISIQNKLGFGTNHHCYLSHQLAHC